MTDSMELSGVIPPLLTPTDAQDRVDEPALRRSIRRLIDADVHGLFVGGTAGEGPLLADREWSRLMEIAFDETAGRLPLLGGVQDTVHAEGRGQNRSIARDRLPPVRGHADLLRPGAHGGRAAAAVRGLPGGGRRHGIDRLQHPAGGRRAGGRRDVPRGGAARLDALLQGEFRRSEISEAPGGGRPRGRPARADGRRADGRGRAAGRRRRPGQPVRQRRTRDVPGAVPGRGRRRRPGGDAAAGAHQPDRGRGGAERAVLRGGAEVRAEPARHRPRRSRVAVCSRWTRRRHGGSIGSSGCRRGRRVRVDGESRATGAVGLPRGP